MILPDDIFYDSGFTPKEMAEIFLVSNVEYGTPGEDAIIGTGVNYPELTIGVSEAKGTKCPRCWMHAEAATEDGLCPRCAGVIAKLEVEI